MSALIRKQSVVSGSGSLRRQNLRHGPRYNIFDACVFVVKGADIASQLRSVLTLVDTRGTEDEIFQVADPGDREAYPGDIVFLSRIWANPSDRQIGPAGLFGTGRSAVTGDVVLASRR